MILFPRLTRLQLWDLWLRMEEVLTTSHSTAILSGLELINLFFLHSNVWYSILHEFMLKSLNLRSRNAPYQNLSTSFTWLAPVGKSGFSLAKSRFNIWHVHTKGCLTNHLSRCLFTGLQRCGKSCRLRWTNYLRPDLKHGQFSEAEEQTIVTLHSVLGNR